LVLLSLGPHVQNHAAVAVQYWTVELYLYTQLHMAC